MKKVKARKDAISGESNRGVENWIRSTDNLDVYQGHAVFTAKNRVEVDGQVLQAKQIFINAGARSFVPPFEGLDEIDYFTSENRPWRWIFFLNI